MPIDINFGALQPANPFAAFTQGQEIGQQNRLRQARQQAGNVFATDPDQASQILMQNGDFEGGLTLRKSAKEDRLDKARTSAVQKYSTGDVKGAQTDAVGAGDFDLASAIGKMDDEQRSQAKARADDLAAVGASIQQLPYEQRKAAIQHLKPALLARGMDSPTIDAFDPTDANIAAFTNQAIGIKGVIEQHDKDRNFSLKQDEFGETRRHNKAGEATAQGQLGVARGNLSVHQQEFQARKAAGGFGTPGVGAVLGTTLPGSPDDWEIQSAGGK